MYYLFGDDAVEWESGYTGEDLDADALSAYVMANVDLGQFYVGGQFAYVQGDDDEYGSEFDITATYKIYDNLSYMVGFGYLCAGDYFEGRDDDRGNTDDNYLVMNKLTLTF